MTPAEHPPNLLTIPCELRNAVYVLVFDHSVTYPKQPLPVAEEREGDLLQINADELFENDSVTSRRPSHHLAPLRTCRQIHDEAHLMAVSLTTFHVRDDDTLPDCFIQRSSRLRTSKLSAIRHMTLAARISQLRALNEEWNGRPFGNELLKLDTLQITPRRPSVAGPYARVSALSQGHTLAYVFVETFKALRNVNMLVVRNDGCFDPETWRIAYRSVIYRMWRWGGAECGVRFEGPDENDPDPSFKVYFGRCDAKEKPRGHEVGAEVYRLAEMTGELPNIDDAGVDP
ncbi:Hypothetical protein R9X50_00058700 [Acrodontium crateriforme]|uniref:Uncharacterized protein n=1 Tax=Acrodontium crateriforme TaxID=150365 RepID=A0AAQ3LXI0_9PEZI|nr:Hypothetical protein R9X50_00058700 [Acrodontium crateriforme]